MASHATAPCVAGWRHRFWENPQLPPTMNQVSFSGIRHVAAALSHEPGPLPASPTVGRPSKGLSGLGARLPHLGGPRSLLPQTPPRSTLEEHLRFLFQVNKRKLSIYFTKRRHFSRSLARASYGTRVPNPSVYRRLGKTLHSDTPVKML